MYLTAYNDTTIRQLTRISPKSHKSSMKNILVAQIRQETATFNPHPTVYDMFKQHHGDEIIEKHSGTDTELAAFIDIVARRDDLNIVPTMSAASVSGGAIPKDDLDRLLDEMINSIKAASEQNSIDAVYMCLHGAMAGVEEDDPEGRLISATRKIVGDIPLVASVDLHAIITDQMLDLCDVIIPFHTYPHVDQYSTGERATTVLLDMLDGKTQPEMVSVKIPMLVRGDELITATGKFGEAIQMCQAIESSDSGIAAGVNIGNAFTDVPELRSNVIVVRNGNREQALDEAARIAQFMWDHRELFKADLMSLEDSIASAQNTDGLTVFSDAADATASGASGDSNEILKGLVYSDFSGRALVPIIDAAAVNAAFTSGVGEAFIARLGGSLDPGRFEPLSLTVKVKSLHDGYFTYENGLQGYGGRVAVLQHQNIDILVVERSVYVVGQRVFKDHGLTPADYDIVVVKSPNGFRPYYEQEAANICAVDVIGSTSANLNSLPFENVARPIFPLDDNPTFTV